MSLREANLDYIHHRWPSLSAQLDPWRNQFLEPQDLSGYTIAPLRQGYAIAEPEQVLFADFDAFLPAKNTGETQCSPYHLLVLGFSPLLLELRQKLSPHHLFLYEPQPWRLLWALDHLDWKEIFAPVAVVSIQCVIQETASSLLDHLRFHNNLLCEEIILAHTGADTAVLAQQITALRVRLYNGWSRMDTRLRSLHNGRQTAKKPNVRRWRPHSARHNVPPVMIVGSGPSAETLMEEIRRLASSCLVVAAGTASHVLLRHGIVPDLAVILGDGRRYYNEHKLATERWPVMREVPLLINQGGDPRFASIGNPLALFGYPDNPRPSNQIHTPGMVAPTVTNTAFAIMAESGFTDFLFFGVDLGARDANYRYAQSHPRIDNEALPEANYVPEMPLRVRGNFGGQVWTDQIFDQARQEFERYLANHPSLRVRNCADGALIRGSQPCIASKFFLDNTLSDKAALVRSLWQEFPLNSTVEFDPTWDLPLFLKELEELRESLLQALQYENLYEITDSLWPLVHHHRPLLALRLMADRLLPMLSGTLYRLHSQPPAVQEQYLSKVRTLLAQSINRLCQEVATILQDMDAGREGDWLVQDEA